MMKTVTHRFGVETAWITEMAEAMGGTVDGNFTLVPEIHTGTRYTLSINEDITVLLADATYHQDILFKLRNKESDFAGIFFNLTEGESVHIMDDVSRSVGRWDYNLAIVDAQLDLDYLIKAGSKSYNISIFVKKKMLSVYLERAGILNDVLSRIFDGKQNTIIHYDHMSSNSWHIINEFRQLTPGGIAYDLFLTSTVYYLLSDYLDFLLSREIIIGKIETGDIFRILASQATLVKHLNEAFPGITELSTDALMSETKYKTLYKKITGFTPHAFFMHNKLELGKELLACKQYTVAEIAFKLSFTSASHFTELFKNQFGMLPKVYVNSL